jgi:LysM repeat protein
MKKSTKLILFALISLLLFSACTRSASKPPAYDPTVGDDTPPFGSVDDQIRYATSTAAAIIAQYNLPTEIVENPLGTQIVVTSTPIPTATPTATPTVTPIVTVVPTSWEIQKGETLECLARRFDVELKDLEGANPGISPYNLKIGQMIDIPQNSKWPGDRAVGTWPRPDVWEVGPEETVYLVACAYGDVWPEEIIQLNNIQDPNDLSGYTTLQIP